MTVVSSSSLRFLKILCNYCLRSSTLNCSRFNASLFQVYYIQFYINVCLLTHSSNERLMQQRASENIRISYAFITYSIHTYNNQMPITVKVQFKDKLYKLAQYTTTISQLHSEMKQRFPNIPPLHYYYQAEEVTDLPALLARAANEGLSSIKLIAKKDQTDMSRLNEASLLAEPKRNDSSVISLLAEDTSKAQLRTRVILPNQFYVCYNCQGAKTIKQMSMIEVCPVCRGAGRLYQGHNYVKRLRELYLKHFRPAEEAQMLLESLKQETVPQRKGSFARVDKLYEVVVRETTRKETVQIGKVYSMKFQIKNIGPSWENKRIQIVEIGEGEGKTLSALKAGQAVQVELGPFICSAEGLLEKTYVLCYREGENLVRFGHKFGFTVRGVKANTVKKLVSNQRERIRDLKMLSGSTKSEQYLSLKLKSMGINVMDLQMEDQVILDVIRQFK